MDRFKQSIFIFLFAMNGAYLSQSDTVPTDLSSAIQAAVNETSYDAVWQTGDSSSILSGRAGAYMAPNRQQNYRIFYTEEGVYLRPRKMQEEAWNLGLHFERFGRAGRMQSIDSVQPEVLRNRVEYKRTENLIEWYVNEPTGLEQGFTIQSPLDDERGSLLLEFSLSGNLIAENVGNYVVFMENFKTILRLENLHAFDALGITLSSRLIVDSGKVIFQINDENAVYPITIDPVIQSEVKLTAGVYDAEEGDRFGISTDIHGYTAVVGACYDDTGVYSTGSAYVFVKKGMGWVQQAKLTASDGYQGDEFGVHTAIYGDTVIVGSKYDDDAGDKSGAAYIFKRNGVTWTEQTKLTGYDSTAGDQFGDGVDLYGDTAAVVASLDDDGGSNSGSVYVYVFDGSSWNFQQKIVPANAAGCTIDIEGDTLVVGSPVDDDGLLENCGSVFIYTRQNNQWTQEANIFASDKASQDYFGYSVSISGDSIVVGAPYKDEGNTNSGAAYVLTWNGSAWVEWDKITPSDEDENGCFGNAVAIESNILIAAAYQNDNLSGSIYVFKKDPTAWNESEKIKSADVTDGDSFGRSMAFSNGRISIGADGKNDRTGSAYIIEYDGANWHQLAHLTAGDVNVDDNFGYGGVDIYQDTAIVSFSYDDDAGVDAGSAYIFKRNGTIWELQAKLLGNDTTTGDRFGFSVSIGENRAVVTSYDDELAINSGSVYVFERNGDVWSQVDKLKASDASTDDFLGYTVQLIDNTIVVGADHENNLTGAVYVFKHDGIGWIEEAKIIASDGTSGDRFGLSVDINESKDVIIIGSYYDNDFGQEVGSAYIFEKESNVWVEKSKLAPGDPVEFVHFGRSVGISGETVVVGSFDDSTGGSNYGRAYVFKKTSGNWIQQQKLVPNDLSLASHFGLSVDVIGNNILVGAYTDDGNGVDSGSAYLYSEINNNWIEIKKLLASDASVGDEFGVRLSLDNNQAIIAARYCDSGALTDAGAVYIFDLDLDVIPKVLSVDPFQNHTHASRNSVISASFSEAMQPGDSNTFVSFGSQSGKLSGSYSGGSSTLLSFDSSNDFKPGERIDVSLTTSLLSTDSIALPTPYAWQFTAATGGTGEGSFWGGNFPFGTGMDYTNSMAVGDLDNDSDLDVVVGNNHAQNILYLNQGNGMFASNLPIGPVDDYTHDVVIGCLNNDAHPDILVINGNYEDNVAYFNNGSGQFSVGANLGPLAIAECGIIADIDCDGDNDILIGRGHPQPETPTQNKIYMNDGSGQFPVVLDFGMEYLGQTRCLATADLNNDGFTDIVEVNEGQYNIVSINGGYGNFYEKRNFGPGNDSCYGVDVGDIDLDGDVDIVVCTGAQGSGMKNVLYLNDGSGYFNQSRFFGSEYDKSNKVIVGDMDSDGDLDIVTANRQQKNNIYFNDGNADFNKKISFGTGFDDTFIIDLGDMDGDGDLDIVAGNAPQWDNGVPIPNTGWNVVYLNEPLPDLNILSPNGGETWYTGSIQNIVYSASPTISSVSLEYSIDSGASWATVASATPVTGAYAWLVPDVTSPACLVRVSDASQPFIYDESDGEFQIIHSNPYIWRLVSNTGPSPRMFARMAYNEQNQKVILHGGSLSGDTWEWDGANWTLLGTSGPPRSAHSLEYDSWRNQLVLYGGRSQPVNAHSDTYIWDGANWINLNVTGPPARSQHGSAFDKDRGVIVIFGGVDGSGNNVYGDTWEWDGTSWKQISTTGPAPRAAVRLAYDEILKKTILYGGSVDYGSYASEDTWAWDGSSWTKICETGPSVRDMNFMEYDRKRGKIVLFGGEYFNSPFGDTWEFDGTTWEYITNNGPSSRQGSAGCYDGLYNQVVLFGGYDWSDYKNDTWVYGPETISPALSFDPKNKNVYRNQDVEIAVSISDASGVVGYRVALDLDPGKVSYIDGSAKKVGTSTKIGWGPLVVNSVSPELAIFTCASATGTLPSASATLLKFQLHVNESLADFTPISVTFNPLTSLNEDALSYNAEIWSATVIGPNNPPSFTGSTPVCVAEDAGPQEIIGWATNVSPGPSYESWQSVYFTIDAYNPNLFSATPEIDSSGTLRFCTAPDVNGFPLITASVVLHDNGGTENGGLDSSAAQPLIVFVTPVNDAPSFIAGATPVVLNATGGPHQFKDWATGISIGPANESSQSYWFTVETGQAEKFSATPSIDASGALSFTPMLGAHGVVDATAILHDDGGTEFGGVDVSEPSVFVIKIYIPFLWGDLNDNAQAGSVDASLLLQYAAELIDAFPGYPVAEYPEYYPNPAMPWDYFPLAADVNADGIAGTWDASYVLQKYAFLIDWFPADANQDQWGPDAPLPPGKVRIRGVTRNLVVDVETIGDSYFVTFEIDNAETLSGLRIALFYDPQQISVDESEAKWLIPNGMLVTNSNEGGRFIAAGALTVPLDGGPRDLIQVKFDRIGRMEKTIQIVVDEQFTQINDGKIQLDPNSIKTIDISSPTNVSEWMVY